MPTKAKVIAAPVNDLFTVLKAKAFETAEAPVNEFIGWLVDNEFIRFGNPEKAEEYVCPILVSDDLPDSKEGLIADRLLLVISRCMTRRKKMKNGREIKEASSVFGKYSFNIMLNGAKLMTVQEKAGTFSFIYAEERDSALDDVLSEFDDLGDDDGLDVV